MQRNAPKSVRNRVETMSKKSLRSREKDEEVTVNEGMNEEDFDVKAGELSTTKRRAWCKKRAALR